MPTDVKVQIHGAFMVDIFNSDPVYTKCKVCNTKIDPVTQECKKARESGCPATPGEMTALSALFGFRCLRRSLVSMSIYTTVDKVVISRTTTYKFLLKTQCFHIKPVKFFYEGCGRWQDNGHSALWFEMTGTTAAEVEKKAKSVMKRGAKFPNSRQPTADIPSEARLRSSYLSNFLKLSSNFSNFLKFPLPSQPSLTFCATF